MAPHLPSGLPSSSVSRPSEMEGRPVIYPTRSEAAHRGEIVGLIAGTNAKSRLHGSSRGHCRLISSRRLRFRRNQFEKGIEGLVLPLRLALFQGINEHRRCEPRE